MAVLHGEEDGGKHDTVGDGGMTNAVAEEPEEEESLKTQD